MAHSTRTDNICTSKHGATTVALTTSPSLHFYFFLLPDARRHTVHVYLFPLLSFALSCHESDYHQRTVGACITLSISFRCSFFSATNDDENTHPYLHRTALSVGSEIVWLRDIFLPLVLSFCSPFSLSLSHTSRAKKKHTSTLNYHNYQFGSSPTGINEANSSDRRDIEQTARRRKGQCM